MTKKHFIALADTLKVIPKDAEDDTVQWSVLLGALAGFCHGQNPNFNQERWFDYIEGKCGPNGGAVKSCRVNALIPRHAGCTP